MIGILPITVLTVSRNMDLFLKENGFFSFIIPKKFGGLEFSATAHAEIIAKVAGYSITAASIIAVPKFLRSC